MTKQEAMRLARQIETLQSLGFTYDEAETLRRISMTLRRWYELECGDGNGMIERDEKTGVPYWFNANARYVQANDPRARSRIPDRERGAEKRLAAIIETRNSRLKPVWKGKRTAISTYLQTDPRGAALYIIRPGDVPAGADVSGYYTRGICVY